MKFEENLLSKRSNSQHKDNSLDANVEELHSARGLSSQLLLNTPQLGPPLDSPDKLSNPVRNIETILEVKDEDNLNKDGQNYKNQYKVDSQISLFEPQNTILEGSLNDTDRTEEDNNFDGDELVDIVGDYYKKNKRKNDQKQPATNTIESVLDLANLNDVRKKFSRASRKLLNPIESVQEADANEEVSIIKLSSFK